MNSSIRAAEDGTDHRSNPDFSRRKFLKSFVVGTAVSTFAGQELWLSVAAACQPAVSGTGVLELNVSQFPPLQDVNGSVRLLFNSLQASRPSGPVYPVLVNRGPGNQFYTLSARCPHQGCAVGAFDPNFAACFCPCHGSRFAIDGALIAGPALVPLTTYINSLDGNILCIEIPGLGYNLRGLAVQNGNAPRFQLQFPTFLNSQYQILFRQAVSAPGTPIPFATTLSGSATNNLLTGTGNSATVYVDRISESGFYTVAIVVSQG